MGETLKGFYFERDQDSGGYKFRPSPRDYHYT